MQSMRLFRSAFRPMTVAAALAVMLPGVMFMAAEAQARPNTRDMTCAQAAGLVRSQGAIVLDTGPNTFDRYVSDLKYCSGFEQLQPEWVRTRDSARCFIGYTCYVPDRNDWGR